MPADPDKAFRNNASPTNPLGTEALAGFCAWADMLEAYRSMISPPAAADTEAPGLGAGTDAASFPQNKALLGFMNQAFLVFATSGVRYWTRSMQTYAKCFPELYGLLTAKNSRNLADTGVQRILLDRLRAMLRELADLPGQESRWMQAELAKLEEQMLSGASRQEGGHVRRARYKQS